MKVKKRKETKISKNRKKMFWNTARKRQHVKGTESERKKEKGDRPEIKQQCKTFICVKNARCLERNGFLSSSASDKGYMTDLHISC